MAFREPDAGAFQPSSSAGAHHRKSANGKDTGHMDAGRDAALLMNPMNAPVLLSPGPEPALPLDTAVVGVGYFGSLHALCYSRLPGSRLQALVDPDPITQSLAEHLGVPWFTCVAELPPIIRAVSVATPVVTHFGLTRSDFEPDAAFLELPIGAPRCVPAGFARHRPGREPCRQRRGLRC